jgi:hypothetical protein
MVFVLAVPLPLPAQEQAATEETPEAVTSATETANPAGSGMARPMRGMGMMHQAQGRHGKGHGGMMQGGGHSDRHAQVLQRLDMIEARLAKIEAMLEILIRR